MAADRNRDHDGMSGTYGGFAVILDSNFLFIPLRFGVDVFEELQRLFGRPILCIIPTPIIAELRLLRLDAQPSFKKEINFALGLTDRCKVINEDVGPGETVDDVLIRIALETGYPVATNDADLRQRLREVGIPVVYLRQRAFLEIDGCV